MLRPQQRTEALAGLPGVYDKYKVEAMPDRQRATP